MNSAENLPPVSGVVANEIPKIPSAANAETFVSPDDLRRNGWWENKEGVRVRVDADKFTLTDYSSGGQNVLYGSLEEIATKLRKEGFTFFPINGEGAEKNKIQVSVREEGAPEEVASDPDLEKRLVEAQELDEKIDQSIKEAEAIAKKIDGFISGANKFSQEEGFEAIRTVLDDITSQAEEKIELVNNLSGIDDLANTLAVDEEYIKEKQKDLEKLQELCGEMNVLSEQASQALESLKKLSFEAVDKEVPPIVSIKGGDVTGESEKGVGKPEKRVKRKGIKSGGSGSDGGDGGDDADLPPKDAKAARKETKRARLLQKEARQQAEGVPVPTVDATTKVVPASEVPSVEPVAAEVSPADTSWRQELDAFLERPKAREKVAMIEDIIQKEWNTFTERVAATASENNAFVSDGEMMRLWQRYGLGDLEDIVAEYIDKNEGMPWQKGRAVFQAIVRNLEESTKNQE